MLFVSFNTFRCIHFCCLPYPASGWRSRPSARLLFDRCAMAPETQLLPAISHAHPLRDVDRLFSGVLRRGEAVIPRPHRPQGRWPLHFPRHAPPYPHPVRFERAAAGYVDCPQAAMGTRHRPGTALGPAGDHPSLFAPPPAIQLRSRR